MVIITLLIAAIIAIVCKFRLWFMSICCKPQQVKNGPVLITGCDSGFGHLLAIKLVENGIHTFAGCYTDHGEKQLREKLPQGSTKLHTFRLDVTDQSSVNKAVEYVKKELGPGKGLWGLVNNAGIALNNGPDDWLNVDDYKKEMEVNFFGVVRVTHAFNPLIKTERGRIVVTASVFGRVAPKATGPYSASKHAVEGYCDTIRQELKHFGVSVHILEPGFFSTNLTNTEIIAQGYINLWQRQPQHVKDEYGEEFFNATLNHVRGKLAGRCNDKIHLVADAYYDALTSPYPKQRYYVGWDAKTIFIPMSFMPTWCGDLTFQMLEKLSGMAYVKPKACQN